MKTIFSVSLLLFLELTSAAQGNSFIPLQPAVSRQPLVMHFSNRPSNHIRIINESGLKRLPGVIKDLSVVLNESVLRERFLPESRELTIYLQDETCASFRISAFVEFSVKDTIYHAKLNRSNEQATDMALAATLIHEIMHCVLLDLYKEAQRGEKKAIASILDMGLKTYDTTNVFDNEFFRIMNIGDEGQHELMSRLLFPQMVLLLKRFAVLHKGPFSNKKAAGVMMWSGLQHTAAYRKLCDEDKRAIVETILSEKGIDYKTE